MAVDVGHRPFPARSRASGLGDVATLLRRLDWVLLAAVATLVGYGLWAVAGITRFDVPGEPDYFVIRQAVAIAIGGVGLVVALAVPPTCTGATGASCTARRSC